MIDEKKPFVEIFIVGLILLGLLAGCEKDQPNPATVVSVSSDGRYAISSHQNGQLHVWDITASNKKVITHNANIYSAYFIKNTQNYLWQDQDNTVHIRSVSDTSDETFNIPIPTYGNLITSDLKNYIYSDISWNIFTGPQVHSIKNEGDSPSFRGTGKLLNLSLSQDERFLLSAGSGYDHDSDPMTEAVDPGKGVSMYGGVVLWDAKTFKPIAKLPGNSVKTYATFSPDGKYVVAVDENGIPLVWQTDDPAKPYMRLGRPSLGIRTKDGWDRTGAIALPPDYIDRGHHGGIISAKFLSNDYFVTIYTYEPFAFLYKLGNPLPIKWFRLGTEPFPSVSDYTRNASIDSAPDAGILVTGQRNGSGINVYKFDEATLSLERVWVGK